MKPTLMKIIIFLVILLFVPFTPYRGPCALPPANCPGLLSLVDIFRMYTPFYSGIILLFLVIGIVISYFISCVIVWIYYKVTKK